MKIDHYQHNVTHPDYRAIIKRTFDILAASLGLLVLSPFFLAVWILIKLDSPGPGFYRSTRVGRNGVLFKMYKFRTMVAAAEKIGPVVTYKDDPRITRLGALLRDRRLDEFPQLINVLKGEMSLVGPRPESAEYVERYSTEQRQILTVKPGVTGPMQIAFLDEEDHLADEDSLDEEYMATILPAKLEKEMEYIQHQSFFYDIFILFQTARTLLLGY
jgi:lipopolysaccharide/colanic/teichoic acid biosynthesis glycosyltransferase